MTVSWLSTSLLSRGSYWDIYDTLHALTPLSPCSMNGYFDFDEPEFQMTEKCKCRMPTRACSKIELITHKRAPRTSSTRFQLQTRRASCFDVMNRCFSAGSSSSQWSLVVPGQLSLGKLCQTRFRSSTSEHHHHAQPQYSTICQQCSFASTIKKL